MYKKLDALFAPEDGDATDGAGGGGSSEQGDQSKQPGDEESVPKKQFIAALASAERKRETQTAALEAQIAELRAKVEAKPPADQPKRFTRAELRAAVEASQITQEQADAEMDRQIREDAKAEARAQAHDVVSKAQQKERVSTEINRYLAVAPEIGKGSDDEARERVAEEYRYLRSLGDAASPETELKAIRAVLGPIDRLEKARSGRASHESHRETGGGGGRQEKPGKDFKSNLDERTRAHYERGIQSGLYKDWDAVREELKYARPRQRMSARA